MQIRLKGKTTATEITGPIINTITVETAAGEVLTLDRHYTEYVVSGGVVDIVWKGVYIWDGKVENEDIPEGLLKGARIIRYEIDDAADDEYGFELTQSVL